MRTLHACLFLAILSSLFFIQAYAVTGSLQNGAKFVGAKSCKECHTERFHSWGATKHPYKLQPVNPNFVIGDFTKKNTFEVKGKVTTMNRRGDDYFITTSGQDGTFQEHKVLYVIGSFWKQRYITKFPDGGLHILPVQWNVQAQNWGDYHGLKKLDPSSGKYWSHPGRTYQKKCLGCHTTGSSYTYDTKTKQYSDTKWVDFGVSCEACHGPGSKHVNASEQDKKESIFNPGAHPDSRRAAMACGMCHNRGSSTDGVHSYPTQGIKKVGTKISPIPFLAGQDLRMKYNEKPGLHGDGSAKKHHQQYNDWKTTGHGRAGVMCWDCHTVHSKGSANQFQLKLPGSSLCISCHTNVEPKGVHGIHTANDCVGCHFPRTAKNSQPFDNSAHTARVVYPEVTVKAGGDLKKAPNSCNICHYHKDHSPSKLQRELDKHLKRVDLAK
jgi:predicted CXXCH cytochrome family protein